MNATIPRTNPQHVVALRNGWSAPLDFYNAIRVAALQQIPLLRTDLNFRAEHFCGPNFWMALSAKHASLAGRCFYDLVYSGELPLKVVPHPGATLWYRRI